jgi:hypothetical protein
LALSEDLIVLHMHQAVLQWGALEISHFRYEEDRIFAEHTIYYERCLTSPQLHGLSEFFRLNETTKVNVAVGGRGAFYVYLYHFNHIGQIESVRACCKLSVDETKYDLHMTCIAMKTVICLRSLSAALCFGKMASPELTVRNREDALRTPFILDTFCKIDDLICLVKDKKDRSAAYMVYVPKNTEELQLGMEVYVGDVPDFDGDDNEILPTSVVALGLEAGYMREHFQDVVDLAYKQKPTSSVEEIIRCLNHYAGYDDFLDLH